MYELQGVSKDYSSRRGVVPALRDVTLRIKRGSFVTITGPSGSGKSTLLLILGGLIRPSRGVVSHKGIDLGGLGERELAAYRNLCVGFVLQSFHLIPYLSARENAMVPLSLGGRSDREGGRRVDQLLQRLGLGERLEHLPRELSVGQQQRVAMARALSNDPEVILADEPTGNLDPRLAAETLKVLQRLNSEEGRTVVMVTHSPEAARIGSHRVHLNEGRCEQAALIPTVV